MRIHIIACRVLNRELSYYASQSPHIVDITWLPQGLHDTPAKLRMKVSETIDSLYEQWEKRELKHMPDVIVLGYGLCSNGVVGIQARDIPLVVPRTDDCIALFLGSQERYLRLFEEYNGTYWLNNGWIETAYIPAALTPGLEERDLVGGSLFAIMEENYHLIMHHGYERISITTTTPEEANYLGTEAGVPAFWIVSEVYGDDGALIEYCRTIGRCDRMQMSSTLYWIGGGDEG